MAEGGRPDKAEGFVLFREPKWVRFQILFAQAFGSARLGMGEGGEGDYRDYRLYCQNHREKLIL